MARRSVKVIIIQSSKTKNNNQIKKTYEIRKIKNLHKWGLFVTYEKPGSIGTYKVMDSIDKHE